MILKLKPYFSGKLGFHNCYSQNQQTWQWNANYVKYVSIKTYNNLKINYKILFELIKLSYYTALFSNIKNKKQSSEIWVRQFFVKMLAHHMFSKTDLQQQFCRVLSFVLLHLSNSLYVVRLW